MLSEREQQAIDEIEQQISEQDPRFVASMQRLLPGRVGRWTRRGYDAVIVVAALSALLCLTLSVPGAALTAVLLAVVTGYLRLRGYPSCTGRRWRRRRTT